MIDKPLLRLSKPTTYQRTKQQSSFNNKHSFLPKDQIQRLSGKIDQLSFQLTTTGIDSETALVIEVKKSLPEFYEYVKKTEGLEWLYDFEYDDESLDDTQNGKFCYLVLANPSQCNHLLKCWRKWKYHFVNENVKETENPLPKGSGVYNRLFRELTDIRQWEDIDRLEERNIIPYFRKLLADSEFNPGDKTRILVEFFYRRNPEDRKKNVQLLKEYFINGSVIQNSECCIPEIWFHGLIAEITREDVDSIVQYYDSIIDDKETRCPDNLKFLELTSILSISPIGQMVSGKRDKKSSEDGIISDISHFDYGSLPVASDQNPIVALFDGYPITDHVVLRNRLNIDDPDNYSELTPVANREHGTAMASLILMGDLRSGEHIPLSRKIYLRPIMEYSDDLIGEVIPEHNRLFVDVLHRAVKRLFEGEGDIPPVSPDVKIINLSIGDSATVFTHNISPLARLLDWLSYRYGILFIVSAGNHPLFFNDAHEGFYLEFTDSNDAKARLDLQNEVLKHIIQNISKRRMLSPAESINAITVGSIHSDFTSDPNHDNIWNPYVENGILPAIYSPFGHGYRASVKPDVLYHGGRQMVDLEIYPDNKVKLDATNRANVGTIVASPGEAGNISNFSYSSGTSNATALVTRILAECYENIYAIEKEANTQNVFAAYAAPLLKTLLVHGCSIPKKMYDTVHSALLSENPEHKRTQSNAFVRRWAGYGLIDSNKITACTSKRATLYHYGDIYPDTVDEYRIKLPSLFLNTTNLRITVTLGWISEINFSQRDYRGSKLELSLDVVKRQVNDLDLGGNGGGEFAVIAESIRTQESKRGTVQHMIFSNRRTKLTDESDLVIQIISKKKNGPNTNHQDKYGLLVTLELPDKPNINEYIYQSTLYDQVKESLTKTQIPHSRISVR